MYESNNYIILDDGRIFDSKTTSENPRRIKLTAKEKINKKFMNALDKNIAKVIKKYEKEKQEVEERKKEFAKSPYMMQNNKVSLEIMDYKLVILSDTIEKLTNLSNIESKGSKAIRLKKNMYLACVGNCDILLNKLNQKNVQEKLEMMEKKENNEVVSFEKKAEEIQQPPIVERAPVVDTPVIARQRPLPVSGKPVQFRTVTPVVEASHKNNNSEEKRKITDINEYKKAKANVEAPIYERPKVVDREVTTSFVPTGEITVSSIEDAKEQVNIVNNKLNTAVQEYNSANQRLATAQNFIEKAEREHNLLLHRLQEVVKTKNNQIKEIFEGATNLKTEAIKCEDTAKDIVSETASLQEMLNNVSSMDPEEYISRGRAM